MPSKSQYHKLRQKHLPKKIELIFLLESPPTSGYYFYNPAGRTTEQLFSVIMKLIDCQPESKADGLAEFARQGYVIADATYSPVNHIKNERKRNEAILRDLPNLIDDLRKIIGRQRVKIILVKANICKMLEEPLKAVGFNVINNGITVPFPGSGQQKNFFHAIRQIINNPMPQNLFMEKYKNKLKIKGPYSFMGYNSIFRIKEKELNGLYFFTFKYNNEYLIEYVGITTRTYDIRFFEHVREFLSGGYKIYDLEMLLKGELLLIWNGRFGKKKDGISQFLDNYKEMASNVHSQLQAYKIFIAPMTGDRILERIEGAIYEQLKISFDKRVRGFIDKEVRYKAKKKSEDPIYIDLESEAKLLGLPDMLEV